MKFFIPANRYSSFLLAIFVLGATLGAVQAWAEALPTLEVDKAKAELGKKLFYDPRLSGDAAIHCGTCHDPAEGFTKHVALGDAYPGTKHFRNAPTLINTAHKKGMRIPWHWDGRIGSSLNDMTRDQITDTYVMNMDMRIMQERIKQVPMYVKMFKEAFDSEPSNGKVRKRHSRVYQNHRLQKRAR